MNEARFRGVYEWARFKKAGAQTAMVVPPIALVVTLSPRLSFALPTGAALVLASVWLWWRGEHFGRAVVPGLVAGAIPFALASVAMQCGGADHLMIAGQCVGWCVLACACGGALGALHIARQGVRDLRFWVSAGLIANLTGALGCSCYSWLGTYVLVVVFAGTSAVAVRANMRA